MCGIMKKVVFIIMIFAAISPLWAQYSGFSFNALMPNAIEKTIIRELQFPASISYVETQTEHYFVYHDGSINPLEVVEINPNLYVKDFVISDDTVFFCGRNPVTDMGFVGHFEISSFFSLTSSYTYTGNPMFCPYGHVASFNKMTTFSLNGARKMGLIGEDPTGQQVVAEIRYSPSISTYDYTTGELPSTSNETFMDITVTDNYVVTAGFRTVNGMRGLNVRVYSKNTMFQTGGSQDSSAYFKSNNYVPFYFYDDQLLLSHHQLDSFSLAAYVWDTNTQPLAATYIGIYNIGANCYVSNALTALASQYKQSGNWILRGMTPVEQSSHFYLLQNAEMPNYNNLVNMVFEMNNNTFVSAVGGLYKPIRVDSDLTLQSIDAHPSYTGFVTNGNRVSDPPYLRYYDATVNGVKCTMQDSVLFHFSIVERKRAHESFNLVFETDMNFITYLGSYMQIPVDIECKE